MKKMFWYAKAGYTREIGKMTLGPFGPSLAPSFYVYSCDSLVRFVNCGGHL